MKNKELKVRLAAYTKAKTDRFDNSYESIKQKNAVAIEKDKKQEENEKVRPIKFIVEKKPRNIEQEDVTKNNDVNGLHFEKISNDSHSECKKEKSSGLKDLLIERRKFIIAMTAALCIFVVFTFVNIDTTLMTNINARQNDMIAPNINELLKNEEHIVDSCNTDQLISNVKVNIGTGKREYYAYTNEYSQLVYITASELVASNNVVDKGETNNSYCKNEDNDSYNEKKYTPTYIINSTVGGINNRYNQLLISNNLTRDEEFSNMYQTITKLLNSNKKISNFEIRIYYSHSQDEEPERIQVSFYEGYNEYAYDFKNNK